MLENPLKKLGTVFLVLGNTLANMNEIMVKTSKTLYFSTLEFAQFSLETSCGSGDVFKAASNSPSSGVAHILSYQYYQSLTDVHGVKKLHQVNCA